MKKRILFVMAALNNGGAERSLVNLLREFDLEKYSVDLLLLKRRGMFLDLLPDGVNVLDTPWQIDALYHMSGKQAIQRPEALLLYGIRLFGTLFSKLRSRRIPLQRAFRWKYFYSPLIPVFPWKYDAAAAYITEDTFWLVSEKLQAERKLVWVHNDYRMDKQPKNYDKPHFARMDGIVTISETCRNVLIQEFPEFREKIFVLPNILSSRSIRKDAGSELPPEWRENHKFKIVSIGRLHPQKGFDMAAEAAGMLKRRGFLFQWYVIGEGRLKEMLEELIRRYQVEDCFFLLGGRKNPYPYLRSADLVVQTSRYEGKSVALDEAKILARPILSTDYPTAKDQIADGKEGMLVPVNASEIMRGIAFLMEHSEIRKIYEEYLSAHEYGNQEMVEAYYRVLFGETGE